MKTFARAAALTAAAVLAAGVVPAASHADQGNQTKNEQGAQTYSGTETFADYVPCASDTGVFLITITVNRAYRFTDDHGHFTQTGTFSAAPVELAGYEVHDEHVHPVAGDPREAATYSGRFTMSGTVNANPDASTESFNFALDGESSEGEQVSAHGVYHEHTSGGEVRSHLDRWTCR